MTKDEYLNFHSNVCADMIRITKAKNSDYTGSSPDPFHNFKLVEEVGVCTTEQGFLTRMSDKFARIVSFTQKGELLVKDESVSDTLKDLANYSILFMGYLEDKRLDKASKDKEEAEKNEKRNEY